MASLLIPQETDLHRQEDENRKCGDRNKHIQPVHAALAAGVRLVLTRDHQHEVDRRQQVAAAHPVRVVRDRFLEVFSKQPETLDEHAVARQQRGVQNKEENGAEQKGHDDRDADAAQLRQLNRSPSQQVVIADRYCGRREIEAEEGDEERRCLCRLGAVVYGADQRPEVLRRGLERYRRTIVRGVLWHPSWSRARGFGRSSPL
jgi:hypothetical protein